ncbi:MAG: hypothetical protein Ct9H300mP31_03720 [Acidimicrobiaceae bacterium]|nr:MAG: hypothetical protein Ct9H300mP31_03720 [Acidimicrobiaceae bacterium]
MGLLCGGAGAVNSVTGPGIRPAESDDLARLVELNNAAVPAVNHLTLDEMAWFLQVAHLCLVAEVPEDGPGSGFPCRSGRSRVFLRQSQLEYFCDRYDRFLYVDRVLLFPVAWGRGLGQGFYRAFIASAVGHTHLCAEVNTVPRNKRPSGLSSTFGFKAIGERSDGGPGRPSGCLPWRFEETVSRGPRWCRQADFPGPAGPARLVGVAPPSHLAAGAHQANPGGPARRGLRGPRTGAEGRCVADGRETARPCLAPGTETMAVVPCAAP